MRERASAAFAPASGPGPYQAVLVLLALTFAAAIFGSYWVWALTAALGGVFLLIQGYEWARLIHFGLTVSSSIYGGLFYTLIGFHAFHVAGALADEVAPPRAQQRLDHPQAQVGGHLVVARARGVEAPGHGADEVEVVVASSLTGLTRYADGVAIDDEGRVLVDAEAEIEFSQVEDGRDQATDAPARKEVLIDDGRGEEPYAALDDQTPFAFVCVVAVFLHAMLQ